LARQSSVSRLSPSYPAARRNRGGTHGDPLRGVSGTFIGCVNVRRVKSEGGPTFPSPTLMFIFWNRGPRHFLVGPAGHKCRQACGVGDEGGAVFRPRLGEREGKMVPYKIYPNQNKLPNTRLAFGDARGFKRKLLRAIFFTSMKRWDGTASYSWPAAVDVFAGPLPGPANAWKSPARGWAPLVRQGYAHGGVSETIDSPVRGREWGFSPRGI